MNSHRESNWSLIAPFMLGLFLSTGLHAPALADTTNPLPEMGDSSSAILTAEEEARIGREMMRKLKERDAILDDPIINEYIQRLGSQIAAGANTPTKRFTFFVVKAQSINAFAMPGGFIGIHAGLLLSSENENELASVIAHEIAHVTQLHIARSVEQANKMNLPITAAVIAAILLGGGEGDPQAANAALAAAFGASQQMKLNFTRANEHEADRVGMQLLAASEFDPRGMADFFARLEEQSRYYGKGAPEFLRTHPVTTDRIAEASDRARQYPLLMKANSHHYSLSKARVKLLFAESSEEMLKKLNSSERHKEADDYLRALIYEKQGKFEAARQYYGKLLEKFPNRIAYIYGLAQMESGQGRHDEAVSLYRKGIEQYPDNELLTLSLADTYMAQRKFKPARELIKRQLIRSPRSREAYHLLARLEAESGNPAASHLAQAEYYYLSGEPHSALDQLNTARRLDSLDLYHASRIDARLEQLKDELSRQKRLPEEEADSSKMDELIPSVFR